VSIPPWGSFCHLPRPPAAFHHVPEGRLKIAQQFTAGSLDAPRFPSVPEGRLNRLSSPVPAGTCRPSFCDLFPSSELLGYFRAPLQGGNVTEHGGRNVKESQRTGKASATSPPQRTKSFVYLPSNLGSDASIQSP
jgi:hypothetical protein